jgi:hypothetical protein
MKILFISPELTMSDYYAGKRFLEVCKAEVENYILGCIYIQKETQIPSIISTLDSLTLIVMFNNKDNNYSDAINKLIVKAKNQNSVIRLIAMDRKERKPIELVSESQSFDVWEQLRLRKLDEGCLNSIALLFARKIVSIALPTMYSENCLLFISHRRLDGEEIAAKLCDKFDVQAKTIKNLRDVVNVEVGQEAQNVIDTALSKSDVLIFLHTNKSGNSKWIEKEIRFALLNNIPIIWIQIDNADINTLSIKPGDKPHFSYNSQDFDDESKLTKIVDDILKISFELIMAHSNDIYDQINTFKDFCANKNLEFIEEDKTQMIYNLQLSRKGYCYPQRKINQYIQYFGRRHNDLDLNKLTEFLYSKKHEDYKLYDSVVLLSNNVKMQNVNDEIIEENCDDFYYNWEKYVTEIQSKYDDEIVISGAFPECDEIYKQSLTDAVNLFSKEILKSGFTLVFGAHPTFQNIIFDIGQKIRPKDYKQAVRMYISKFFENKYKLSDLIINATVCETKNIESDLLKSLTEMRTNMIGRSNVKALICMGGIIRENNVLQGIDEEIKIAKANNIPVFLIGSVGGRSSQLAAEYKASGKWSELNNASVELNELLTYALDYRKLIYKIIEYINL